MTDSNAIEVIRGTLHRLRRSALVQKFWERLAITTLAGVAALLAGKIFARLDGRYHVARADIEKAALPALRHRIILNFEGEAEGKTSDEIIAGI